LPDAHITLVIRPGTKGIFSEADFIDDVLLYDRKGCVFSVPQIREWKRRKFDLAVLVSECF
jgi:ADP-heptose:LPS heptosyltransferase